jgi:hypothetical protein
VDGRRGPVLRRAPADDHIDEDVQVEDGQHILILGQLDESTPGDGLK